MCIYTLQTHHSRPIYSNIVETRHHNEANLLYIYIWRVQNTYLMGFCIYAKLYMARHDEIYMYHRDVSTITTTILAAWVGGWWQTWAHNSIVCHDGVWRVCLSIQKHSLEPIPRTPTTTHIILTPSFVAIALTFSLCSASSIYTNNCCNAFYTFRIHNWLSKF